ncbi:hypothetical protein PA10_00126 [Pseudomonas phage pPa_SNUABM_DT01]|nr:hypothetical protein PA10_00126 [Pseudomonas phage pPa_SNUABM_DT01]
MDLITVALDRLRNFEIPQEVLRYAFSPTRYDPTKQGLIRDYSTGISNDTVIRRQIIEGRVLVDMNLCSGVEVFLPLTNVPGERVDNWTYIYRIPKELTQGRSITEVYGLSYGQGHTLGNVGVISEDRSMVLEAAAGVMQSNAAWTQVQSAYCTLVADNTVMVTNMNRVPGISFLRCLVTHDPNLANISGLWADKFSEMVTLACKAWIFNKTVIPLDEGAIRGGASLGRIREIIDTYADANQMYKEFFTEKWRKSGVMANKDQHRRLLRYVVGSRR